MCCELIKSKNIINQIFSLLKFSKINNNTKKKENKKFFDALKENLFFYDYFSVDQNKFKNKIKKKFIANAKIKKLLEKKIKNVYYALITMKKIISKCYKFNIHKIHNNNAFISVYENFKFKVKRFYILYNLKKNQYRNGHSHKKLEQIYICVSGGVKVYVENKYQKNILF